MTIENINDMQIEMKKNVLKNQFRNRGCLVGRYMEKANNAASKGMPIMADYWNWLAIKCAESRDKIVAKIDALSV